MFIFAENAKILELITAKSASINVTILHEHVKRQVIMYIYEQKDWPNFYWKESRIAVLLHEVTILMGTVIGKMAAAGSIFQKEVLLQDLTDEIVKTSAIEGEHLNIDEVRSSVARKLDIQLSKKTASIRRVPLS